MNQAVCTFDYLILLLGLLGFLDIAFYVTSMISTPNTKPSHIIGCLASGSGPHKIGIEWRFHFFFFVLFSLYLDTNLLLSIRN